MGTGKHDESPSDTDTAVAASDTQETGPYRIGVVGVGHWATKFEEAIDDAALTFSKAIDVASYADKKEILDTLGMDKDSYKPIASGDPLPEGFFEDVDVVQIASPIQFHEEQTLQALEQADTVVTEKSYGPSIDAYESVMKNVDDAVLYPHLHYLRKQPTHWLHDNIDGIVEEYGPIRNVEATFIEEEDTEDIRRSWILKPENGGIAMDWIHPIEVLCATTDASFPDIIDTTGYITNTKYSREDPTAIRTTYQIDGDSFSEDATATVRIGKGFDEGYTRKAMRFEFDDAVLDVHYTGSSHERETDYRGTIMLHEREKRLTPTTVTTPIGETPYELMAEDMVAAIEEDASPSMLEQLPEMYRTVDMTNEAVYADEFVTDEQEIYDMVQDGFEKTSL